LNREELLRLRWKTYRPIAMLCRLYDRDRLTAREAQETEATLREAMASSQPFAGLCRWAIREEAGLAL
jgi:hypothetical protein